MHINMHRLCVGSRHIQGTGTRQESQSTRSRYRRRVMGQGPGAPGSGLCGNPDAPRSAFPVACRILGLGVAPPWSPLTPLVLVGVGLKITDLD